MGERLGSWTKGSVALAATLTIGAGLLSACSSGKDVPEAQPVAAKVSASDAKARAAFFARPADLAKAAPGTLVRHQVVTGIAGVPAGAQVQRVLFHSRTIYGVDSLQSGYVITPAGTAPAGGWPTVAWAHGTSGFAAPCGPSRFDAQGPIGIYLVPELERFLSAGYAISAADYQGLGVANGVHPYLVGKSEGQSVLDALRASNALLGEAAASEAIIYGHSQGGHAALFAAELAPSYAPELKLKGVVAAAPATGMSSLISVVSSNLGAGFMPFSIPAAWGWTENYRDLPENLLFNQVGVAFAKEQVTKGCSGELSEAIKAAEIKPTDIFNTEASGDEVVVAHGRLNDPGRAATKVPMLVLQGDLDGTVPAILTTTYVSSVCKLGDTVDYLQSPTATHGTIVTLGADRILSWMGDRLAGRAAPSTCGDPANSGLL